MRMIWEDIDKDSAMLWYHVDFDWWSSKTVEKERGEEGEEAMRENRKELTSFFLFQLKIKKIK